MKTKHTPEKWEVSGTDIRAQGGLLIATMHKHLEANNVPQEANAKRIVQCVNNFDDLLKALQKLYDAFPLNKMNIKDNFSEMLIHNEALKTIKEASEQ